MCIPLLRKPRNTVYANKLHVLVGPIQPPKKTPGEPLSIACRGHLEPPDFDALPEFWGALLISWIYQLASADVILCV
jgi:hypothetical protein